MINPISNINFKGVYAPKFTRFSDSQQKVYDDIIVKLGKKAQDHDFFVKPAKDDSVELSEVYDIIDVGHGLDSRYSYVEKIYIGRYDENNLFEMKDYKSVCKKRKLDLLGAISASFLFVGIAFGILALSNKKPVAPQESEKVITVAKDSLQLVKDSLKVLK